jgi:heme-degrading monooxygenase HmoA
MFCSLFEVLPAEVRKNDYMAMAKYLKPLVQTIVGFVDMESYESQLRHGWMLALHMWRDEKSVVRWRTEAEHHKIQEKGRFQILQDFHVRLGDVTSDTPRPKKHRSMNSASRRRKLAPQVRNVYGARPKRWHDHSGGDAIPPARRRARTQRRQHRRLRRLVQRQQPGQNGSVNRLEGRGPSARWTPAQIEGIASLRHRRLRDSVRSARGATKYRDGDGPTNASNQS